MAKQNVVTWAEMVAKSWADPAFRKELMRNPKKIIQKAGWEVPDSTDVVVTAGVGPTKLHLQLPDRPKSLSDERGQDPHPNPCSTT